MLPWAFAYSLLPLVAYYIRDWRDIQLVSTIPLPPFLLFYWCLPECPRWLLSKGRVVEATKILEKAARINGLTNGGTLHFKLNQDIDSDAKKVQPLLDVECETSSNILDLFKTPNLRRITLISWFIWFSNIFVYYGLTLNTDTLIPGDVYINTAVSGLIEIPAYTFCIIIVHFLGRRIPLAMMYLSSGVFLLATIFMEEGTWTMVVSMMGKFGIICLNSVIYLHASEMFPTVVRSAGLCTCSMWGRVGSMVASIVGRELGRVNRSAAIMVFAFPSFTSGLLTFCLPETKGQKLPDTIEEGKSV